MMKLLKNIVIIVGLLLGFIQANAMESKVFLGTWQNDTDHDIIISGFNPFLDRETESVILPAHSKAEINKELLLLLKTSYFGNKLTKHYHLAFDYNQLKKNTPHDWKLICTLEEDPLEGFRLFDAQFSRHDYTEAEAKLDLSQFTQINDIYIDGIINESQSKILLRPKPSEVPSLKEQSMKATIQKLKKEGKILEEAKQIIPHDLHNLLLENWWQ